MAAHILVTVDRMEKQQQAILKSTAKENKEVIETLQKGMKENTDIIKDNIVLLKAKIDNK